MAVARAQQVGVVLEILEANADAKRIALDSSGWRAGLVALVVRELNGMTVAGVFGGLADIEQRPTTDEVVEGIMRFRDAALLEQARSNGRQR